MLMPNQLIEVRVISKTKKHYQELGYDVSNIKIPIMVPPEHLTNGSHEKVKVICDICQQVFDREYKLYLQCHSGNLDTCLQCKSHKARQTCLEKYGVQNVFQVQDFKDKHKQTCLERYGYEYISQIPEVQQKVQRTWLENYGVSNPMQSDQIKAKLIQTNMEKYGTYNVMQNLLVAQKAKETNLQRYGTECAAQNQDVRNKIVQTCLQKYGVSSPLQSTEVLEKIKTTNLDKYGVENPFSASQIQQKIKETNLLKYGHVCPLQNPDIRTKAVETLYKNQTVATSAPQQQIYNIIKNKYAEVELNYPLGPFSLDVFVCVDNIYLDVEYDGWFWHQDALRDIKRDKVTLD